MEISPKYLMSLIAKVEKSIWDTYTSYKNVENYINRWHKSENDQYCGYSENFAILRKKTGEFDLINTLHSIQDGELLLKIAIDLGIETPEYIPAVSHIINRLKVNYTTAFESLSSAIKQINDSPDIAIGMANSTLESIIKHILEDERFSELNKKATLSTLINNILKEFEMHPSSDMLKEYKTIGSSFVAIANAVETIRSNKTMFHGKTRNDLIIDDPIYAHLIVNSISTIGLFLIDFYVKKFKSIEQSTITNFVGDIDLDKIQTPF